MDEEPEIRVVAAAFADVRSAAAAEAELRNRLDVEAPDIGIAEAGGDRGRAGLRGLLIGRFRRHRRDVVDAVVERHHGEVVEDLPEARVFPRQQP
jgi:hypothetical protein